MVNGGHFVAPRTRTAPGTLESRAGRELRDEHRQAPPRQPAAVHIPKVDPILGGEVGLDFLRKLPQELPED